MATYSISKIQLPNGDICELSAPIYYGTCSTAAATAAKEVSITGVTALTTGLTITVAFTNSNTASSPTLKVNTLDAKSIKRYGTTAPSTSAASSWQAGAMISLTYDGRYWVMNDWLNTTYSSMTASEISAGTGTTARTITPANLKTAIQTWEHVHSVNGQTGDVVISASSIYWVEINGTVNWSEVAAAIADGKTIIGYEDYGDGDVAYYACVESIVANSTTASEYDGLEFACAGSGYILRASWYGGNTGWSSAQTFFVPNTRTVNGKALSSNITLDASDVGALSTSGGTATGEIKAPGLTTIKPDNAASAPNVYFTDDNGNICGQIFLNYYLRNGVYTPYRLYFREKSLSSTTNLPLTTQENFRLPAADFDRSANQTWEIWTTKSIPEPPTTNGTYTLKATRTSSGVTYSWT